MMKSLLILFLTFSFQTLTKADDIRDFEIEGMSIGDSLLNFYNEKTILKNIVDWYDDNEKNRYLSFAFGGKNFNKYDYVDVWTKYNDKDYKIEAISGVLYFGKNKDMKDIQDCYVKQKKIANEISKLFTNTQKEGPVINNHNFDKTGNSTYTDIYFYFKNDYDITISCYDWSMEQEDEGNRKDHFAIFMRSTEVGIWLD